jgi:glycosyltransferase involved in cell wall biosynthesis
MRSSRKKVLFITSQPFFEWRGSPIRNSFTLQALSEIGYDVDFLTLPIGREREVTGVKVKRVSNPFRIRMIPIGPSARKVLFDVLLFEKALRLSFKTRYDIIHSVEDAGSIGLIIAKLFRSTHIFEKHSDPYSYRRGVLRNCILFLYKKIEEEVIKYSDSVIGTGPKLADVAKKIDPEKAAYHISDIPSSLSEPDHEEVVRIREILKCGGDDLIIMYVGSFALYQGIDLMFQSIPPIVRDYQNAKFVIIGGSEEEIILRKKWLSDRGSEGRVVFQGKVAPGTLPNYLAAADILLSPRIAGTNTPLKVLDYLKVGRAILATDVEANRQILDESVCILVKPEPDAFVKGLSRLMSDSELRERLGAQGKKLIHERYNFTNFKSLLARCYKNAGL